MAVQKSRLLISYTEEIKNGEPIYFSSNCLPFKASKFEPAGHAFNTAALKLLGCFEKKEVKKDENSDNVNVNEGEAAHTFDSYSNKSKKKSGETQQDHYSLLGLSHLRYLATEDQIRKAYRDTALRYHPDKQAALLLGEETEARKQAKKDEIESHFKAVQEAYEHLSDPVKRRVYDSTDEFDDKIPNDCTPQEFFKVFGPVFMRNGRWSVNQPVPSLGDDNTPIIEVDKFYDFWYSFKSWREFPQEDEFDLEEAESRDHKRWMERQNAKLSEKARKEESTRIRVLIENAYRKDPRILRRKELDKAEKMKKKEAKAMVKRMQEEEAARVIEEERVKKEEAAKKAAEIASQMKKLREKEKKLLRKERARLRNLAGPVVLEGSVKEGDVESLCSSLTFDKLKGLCDKIDGKEVLRKTKVLKVALGFEQDDDEEEETVPEPEPPLQNGGSVKAEVLQNGGLVKDEVLQNGGSVKDEVHQNGGLVKVEEEVVKKEKAWSKEEIELLRKAIHKYPKGTSNRWGVISEYIGTSRTIEEILKATKTVLLQKPDDNKAFDSFLERRKTSPSIVSPLSTREEEETVTNGNVGPETVEEEEEDTWSVVQGKALLQALKTFPKEANQRWERVAAAVPGKNVNQCKKKFASMKESFRNKKSGV